MTNIFSKETLLNLGIRSASELVGNHPPTPSGLPALDAVLGGGWEPGVNVISGLAGTGKSLLCAVTTASLLAQGKPVLIVDTEGSFDVWQNHFDLSQAWNIAPSNNPFLTVGHDIENVKHHVLALIDHASQIGAPLGAIVIDSLDALCFRSDQSQVVTSEYYADDANEQAGILGRLLSTLHQTGLAHHIPILVTHHNYESPTGYYDGSRLADFAHSTQLEDVNIQSVADQNLAQFLAEYSSIRLDLSTLYQYPGNAHYDNTPFIAPGRLKTGKFAMIDFDEPDHLLLAIRTIKTKRRPTSPLTTIPVPFNLLTNFEYVAPTDPNYELHRSLSTSKGESDVEPDETALSNPDTYMYSPHPWDEGEEDIKIPSSSFGQIHPWQ